MLLAGCYEDKGNYDYSLDSMNEILSVTFSPSVVKAVDGNVIEVQQALDENSTLRRLDVTVEQTLAKDLENLDFFWCRTYTDEEGNEHQTLSWCHQITSPDGREPEELGYTLFESVEAAREYYNLPEVEEALTEE